MNEFEYTEITNAILEFGKQNQRQTIVISLVLDSINFEIPLTISNVCDLNKEQIEARLNEFKILNTATQFYRLVPELHITLSNMKVPSRILKYASGRIYFTDQDGKLVID
ncbi:hypothetical protein JWG44_05435 [Leptospira sp. 201903071]|uniref:hypothetical protein n=1 Tax=Leptospira ainazelensis TaxID=2810034 RepID=UPI001965F1A2|nr:hypothetical protein [Leptospira ainazelensis]MBM9499692.1 hypothetical protein [Leptospira ainazelensis]